jgi:hypothetical protein
MAATAAKAALQTDTLNLTDGTKMDLTRLPEIDDNTWSEVRAYLERNPVIAKNLQSVAKDADAIRSWLQTQAIAEHYNKELGKEDGGMQAKMKALEQDPELAPMLEKIKTEGLEAALKACGDDELMVKISQKMGGIPPELVNVLKKLDETSLTVHEACKKGDVNAVKVYLTKKRPVDDKDPGGITGLGFAIGADKPEVVKLLIESHANPHVVDSKDNSGLHYAAGYGRVELVQFLLAGKANVNKANGDGQTPLAVATHNNQRTTMQILQQHGARA